MKPESELPTATEGNRPPLPQMDSAGPSTGTEKLMALVYNELRAIAAGSMRRERAAHTLQPTALVHEAYLRLADQKGAVWKSREHFVAVASQVIRRVLIDHARGNGAFKRGGGNQRIELESDVFCQADGVDLLALDEALQNLKALDEQQARIVELRYFGGLTIEETADALDISPTTVKVQWATARAWLRGQLGP